MNTEQRYIERKSLIYETNVEYAKYAINHILGCAHSCSYCYAYKDKRRWGQVKDREEWKNFRVVMNALAILNKELPRWKEKIGEDFIHLCFTTDPFMFDSEMGTLFSVVELSSLHIIKLINDHGLRVETLTKGFYPIGIIKFNLSNKNSYGISLSSLNEKFRKEYEPYTAPYYMRISRLKLLHDYGLKTWVSIEPYPTPNIIEQSLQELLESISFVDKIVFGKMNYVPKATGYYGSTGFYHAAAHEVIDFCRDSGIEYYIKEGTIT